MYTKFLCFDILILLKKDKQLTQHVSFDELNSLLICVNNLNNKLKREMSRLFFFTKILCYAKQ